MTIIPFSHSLSSWDNIVYALLFFNLTLIAVISNPHG